MNLCMGCMGCKIIRNETMNPIDLFGNPVIERPVVINIYADEIMSKKCPDTGNEWHYIGIIVEDVNNSLLDDIIAERFCNNFDESSPYYKKNNKIVHWADIGSADEKNICKRWFKYILDVSKSSEKFYTYILGLNNTFLDSAEFDMEDEFNSKYNRFFRSTILYALKCFFSNKKIIVRNIYHEQGQQQHHKYFPWHSITKISSNEKNITFETNEIIFLGKDHRKDKQSNILQLCDCFLGAVTTIIHGFEKSNRASLREELLKMIFPLVDRMINESDNKNSSYKHAYRIMIRFFPKEKTSLGDLKRYSNQFYTQRKMKYKENISGQQSLF